MLYRLVVASLFVAATAHAQAPGDGDGQYYGPSTYPANTPVSTAPCTATHYGVMANRWAVGLSVGSFAVAPDSQPDAKREFGIGELDVRFRATPHLELQLAFGGGREKLADGTQGDQELSTGMIAARYRFAPEQPWNWYLMIGIGGMSVASHTATDEERKAVERPMGTYGIGVERRFERFALDAELRGIGVGQNDNTRDVQVVAVPPTMAGSGTTTVPVPPNVMSTEHQSGGQLTIGAAYYF